MSILLKLPSTLKPVKVFSRAISSSSALNSKQWREKQGLSGNRNAEGVLTDGPDYSYLDGRPTPLLIKQKKRMEWQQILAKRIVRMINDVDFAKERHQQLQEAKERERREIIAGRLKPKGVLLLQQRK